MDDYTAIDINGNEHQIYAHAPIDAIWRACGLEHNVVIVRDPYGKVIFEDHKNPLNPNHPEAANPRK